MNFKRINLSKIKHVENSRGEIGDLHELMLSIKSNGLINPITVTKTSKSNDYTIVAGHRRFNAYKKLGRKTIECNVVDNINERDILIKNLTENVQRKDTTPLEEGRYFAELVEKHKLTHEEIAARVGCKPSRVASAIMVLKTVPDEFKLAVSYDNNRQGKGLSVAAARDILNIARDNHLTKPQRNKLFQGALNNQLTRQELLSFSAMQRMNPELTIAKFMKRKDKFQYVTFRVPLFKSEIDTYKDDYDMKQLDVLTSVVYGELPGFTNVAKTLN